MHGKIAVELIENMLICRGQRGHSSSVNTPNTNDQSPFVPIDIILMDIQMPVMNGFDATKAIRALEAKYSLPPVDSASIVSNLCIIAMSANAEFSTYHEAMDAGANAFIHKPFTIDLFQETLARYYDHRSST
jgi:CheY-like chemotaxis protein